MLFSPFKVGSVKKNTRTNMYFTVFNLLFLFVTKIASQNNEYSYEQRMLSTQHEINVLRGQVTETLNTLNYKLQILDDLYSINCSYELICR